MKINPLPPPNGTREFPKWRRGTCNTRERERERVGERERESWRESWREREGEMGVPGRGVHDSSSMGELLGHRPVREDGRAVWRDHREFSVSAAEASRCYMLSSTDVSALDSRKFGDENGGGRVTVLYRLDDVERLSYAKHGGAEGLEAKLKQRSELSDGVRMENHVLREQRQVSQSGDRDTGAAQGEKRGSGKVHFHHREVGPAGVKRGPYAVMESEEAQASFEAKKVKKEGDAVEKKGEGEGEEPVTEPETEPEQGSSKIRAIRGRLVKQVEGVLEWDPKKDEGNVWRVEVRGMDEDTFMELMGIDSSRELKPRDLVSKGVRCDNVLGRAALKVRKTFTARGEGQVEHVLGVAETVDLEYTRSSQCLSVSGATRVIRD